MGKKKSELGQTLIKNRFQTSNSRLKFHSDGSFVKHHTDPTHTTTNNSITQENDLDAFLTNATLAGTEFTAEKLNVQVVVDAGTDHVEKKSLFKKYQNLLTVPKRPKWDGVASPDVQAEREREAFLTWRRSLVILEEEKNLLLTPYERNIQVWRHLWRVLERSDILVQIVDARNPLLYRCPDLETYASTMASYEKSTLIVLNKADMVSSKQREAWADYFDSINVRFVFFSAALAKMKVLEEEVQILEKSERELKIAEEKAIMDELKRMGLNEKSKHFGFDKIANLEDDAAVSDPSNDFDIPDSSVPDNEELIERLDDIVEDELSPCDAWKTGCIDIDNEPERIRILSCDALLDRIMAEYLKNPRKLAKDDPHANLPITFGFVGYPNVGKSSTLNALLGSKKCNVSSTPGKTKHFQTLYLDKDTLLCDCPGLVFPSFTTTKADLVLAGVLPIDQLRDHTGPCELLAQRVPRQVLESIYGIKIRSHDSEGNLTTTGPFTGTALCSAYAVARGFRKAGQGNPDESRAARIILKDYVDGKLLFCHPPPIEKYSDFVEFNKGIHHIDKKVSPKVENYPAVMTPSDMVNQNKSVDSQFFKTVNGNGANIKGKFIVPGGFTRADNVPLANAKGKAPMSSVDDFSSKKHKKGKRGKVRVNWTKDETCD